MRERFASARYEVWSHARKMWEAGLVAGSSGNVSARIDDQLIAITPTSVPYSDMEANQIVVVDVATGQSSDSHQTPSYELPMHLVMYRKRSDIGAIVHTHAPFVTTLSVLHRSLPPMLDETVVHLGGTIEVAEYAFTGTEAIGRNVLRALGDCAGVILANHGNVCIGSDLPKALHAAIAMEAAARVFVQALQIGEPVLLPEKSIEKARKMFEKRRV